MMRIDPIPEADLYIHGEKKCDKCKRYFRVYELVEVHRNNVVVKTVCGRCYHSA